MIHLVGPVVLAAALAGTGVYGLLARRNAVLVLIGAELLLAAAGVLLVTANALPAGGLAQLTAQDGGQVAELPADPLLPGQVMTVFAITIAAAEVGLALAVILLLFRARSTSDLDAVRELGEASPTYTETPGADAPGVDLPLVVAAAPAAAPGPPAVPAPPSTEPPAGGDT
ncbi:NADH-quinone oxidoreductase subunit K [Kineosporia sp. A_224]|uniref:NADH-quinone oxidoreductase subunit NuoK n=1 Tax=Kineosporia sp. A_224 TaxID=1962180 RepID=UPI000B4B8E23|nr:NADH-quinone oxidoreductase subunit K [Kineosporia sp. A_224]